MTLPTDKKPDKYLPDKSKLPSCFPAGTSVRLADGNDRAIDTLKPGVMVLSYNQDHDILMPARILKVYQHPPADLLEIRTETRVVRATSRHPFLTDKGWVAAGEMKTGSHLIQIEVTGCELKLSPIVGITHAKHTEPLFNLTVADTYSFIANGNVVHCFGRLRSLRVRMNHLRQCASVGNCS